MRISLLLLCMLFASVGGLHAQGDTSLTKDFSHLSAKERARLAKQEQEGAANDTEYQRIMVEAEDLFRRQQYDEALVRFQDARQRRPLNVYPKVKIQDLQALIAKREVERTAAVEPPKVNPDPITKLHVVIDTTTTNVEPVPVAVQPAPKLGPVEQPKPPAPVKVMPKATPATTRSSENGAPLTDPDGTVERMHMEGRAVVLERTVTIGGRATVYRKVTHPYGQVNYFRDGIATSERVWQEAAVDR